MPCWWNWDGPKNMEGSKSRPLIKGAYRLIQFLSQKKNLPPALLVLTHDYPDPDALASAFALYHLLHHCFRVPAKIVYGGIIGRVENQTMVRLLKIPIHKVHAKDFREYSHVALVDTQPGFKNNSFPKNKKAFLIIDQHESVKKPTALLSLIDTGCGASCVIVAQALLMLKAKIPPPVATALIYGILTDTNNLYRVKRRDVIQTYLNLLPYSQLPVLAKIQNPSRPLNFFTLLSRGMKKAHVLRGLIVAHLGFIKNPDFVSQIADFLLTYRGMRTSLCTGRFRGRLYVSLRLAGLKAAVPAHEILRSLFLDRGEAGGHDTIAGGSFKVSLRQDEKIWSQVEENLTFALLRRLHLPTKGKFIFPFRGAGV